MTSFLFIGVKPQSLQCLSVRETAVSVIEERLQIERDIESDVNKERNSKLSSLNGFQSLARRLTSLERLSVGDIPIISAQM